MMDLNELMQKNLGEPGMVITKSVVLVEVYDGETRSLKVMASDMPIWDMVGMLRVVGEDATAYYVGIEPTGGDEGEPDGAL